MVDGVDNNLECLSYLLPTLSLCLRQQLGPTWSWFGLEGRLELFNLENCLTHSRYSGSTVSGLSHGPTIKFV